MFAKEDISSGQLISLFRTRIIIIIIIIIITIIIIIIMIIITIIIIIINKYKLTQVSLQILAGVESSLGST